MTGGVKRKPGRYDISEGDDAIEVDSEAMVGSLIKEMHDNYISAVIEKGNPEPVCEEPDVGGELWDDAGWGFVDDVKGSALDPAGVREARETEMGFVRSMGI